MSLKRHGAIALAPFLSAPITDADRNDDDTKNGQSTWLIVPYFATYTTMSIINTVISPLLLLERSCIHELQDNEVKERFFDEYAVPNKSCIATYMNGNVTDKRHLMEAYSMTLYIMIAVIFASGNVAALSYFLIWKPLLNNYRNVALFLPPGLVLAQTIFLTIAQTFQHFNSYKYMFLAGSILPGLHGGLQGVFLLFYRMTKNKVCSRSREQEITFTKLDCSDTTFFLGFLFSGVCIFIWFDMRYYFLFMLQFALGCVGLVYAMSLLTVQHAFMTGEEEVAEKDAGPSKNKSVDRSGDSSGDKSGEVKMSKVWRLDSDSDVSIEEFDARKIHEDRGFVVKQFQLLKHASLVFSGTSHKMELVVIVEVCVFTVAMTTDMGIGVLYLLQTPLGLDISLFGGGLVIQGIMKLIGFAVVKILIYFRQIKHGTLITVALINYMIYYFLLSINWSRGALITAMFVNVFGGLAFPAIASIIETNFSDTAEVVLELSILCSYVGTMVFSAGQCFIFDRTLGLWAGAVFAISGGVVIVGGLVILATYLSTSQTRSERDRDLTNGLLGSG